MKCIPACAFFSFCQWILVHLIMNCNKTPIQWTMDCTRFLSFNAIVIVFFSAESWGRQNLLSPCPLSKFIVHIHVFPHGVRTNKDMIILYKNLDNMETHQVRCKTLHNVWFIDRKFHATCPQLRVGEKGQKKVFHEESLPPATPATLFAIIFLLRLLL